MTLDVDRSGTGLSAGDTSAFAKAYMSLLPTPPNAGVISPGIGSSLPTAQLTAFASNINAYTSFLQVQTAQPLTYYLKSSPPLQAGATLTTQGQNAWTALNSSGAQFTSNWMLNYWDYYDVGEPYSSSLVGYDLTTHYPAVSNYVNNSYKVTSILREAKKYETPLALSTAIIGHGNLALQPTGSSCSGNFEHDISGLSIAGYAGYSDFYTAGVDGFWLASDPPANLPSTTTAAAAMQALPLTLRFFQDGQMILHLETDSAANFNQVKYSFQK